MIQPSRVALLLVLLAGCAAGPPPTTPRQLLLSFDGPMVPAAASSGPRKSLVVRAVNLPEWLDRRALLQRASDTELREYPDAVWAERPGKAITRYLAQSLAAQRGDYEVQAFSVIGAPAAVLTVSLEHCEADTAKQLRLRGSWVLNVEGKASISGRLDADVPLASDSAEASVTATRTALDGALAVLARQLP